MGLQYHPDVPKFIDDCDLPGVLKELDIICVDDYLTRIGTTNLRKRSGGTIYRERKPKAVYVQSKFCIEAVNSYFQKLRAKASQKQPNGKKRPLAGSPPNTDEEGSVGSHHRNTGDERSDGSDHARHPPTRPVVTPSPKGTRKSREGMTWATIVT